MTLIPLSPYILLCLVPHVLGLSVDQQRILNTPAETANILNPSTLNFSSPAPHLFASTHALLRQWPSTFFPNGHSIVPCEIRPYTNLYHGRKDEDFPTSPEWFAFDIEMAYGIMGSSRSSHMLTYQTTRAVHCLYFDGESATLVGHGRLDSQMLFIYGNTTGPPRNGPQQPILEEYGRAVGLCNWLREEGLGGPGWGVESIIRMSAGFELIWCNFTSPSLRLVSHLNVTLPLLPKIKKDGASKQALDSPNTPFPLPTRTSNPDLSTDPTSTPEQPDWPTDEREPFVRSQAWQWLISTTRHYGTSDSNGETRVRPITCGILSFYSSIFENQTIARAEHERDFLNLTEKGIWRGPGQEEDREGALKSLTRRRRSHRLDGVTKTEAAMMNEAVKHVLLNFNLNRARSSRGGLEGCSGIDWRELTDEIVQRYSSSLIELLDLVAAAERYPRTMHDTASLNWLAAIRDQTHGFLLPFFEYPSSSNSASDINKLWNSSSPLARTAYSRCRYHHTRLLVPEEGVFLGPEEASLKQAVEETLGGICSMIIDVGFSVEREWSRGLSDAVNNRIDVPWEAGLKLEAARWKRKIEELMAWLGWAGEWTGCTRKCKRDERCYIPMWPLIRGTDHGADSEEDLWEPKCVKVDYIMA